MEPHLRMFPLNYCSGLPEYVEEYENPLGFQTSTSHGAHLVFSRNIRGWFPLKQRLHSLKAFFHIHLIYSVVTYVGEITSRNSFNFVGLGGFYRYASDFPSVRFFLVVLVG